jgi:small-conductance mechanosensitive channel
MDFEIILLGASVAGIIFWFWMHNSTTANIDLDTVETTPPPVPTAVENLNLSLYAAVMGLCVVLFFMRKIPTHDELIQKRFKEVQNLYNQTKSDFYLRQIDIRNKYAKKRQELRNSSNFSGNQDLKKLKIQYDVLIVKQKELQDQLSDKEREKQSEMVEFLVQSFCKQIQKIANLETTRIITDKITHNFKDTIVNEDMIIRHYEKLYVDTTDSDKSMFSDLIKSLNDTYNKIKEFKTELMNTFGFTQDQDSSKLFAYIMLNEHLIPTIDHIKQQILKNTMFNKKDILERVVDLCWKMHFNSNTKNNVTYIFDSNIDKFEKDYKTTQIKKIRTQFTTIQFFSLTESDQAFDVKEDQRFYVEWPLLTRLDPHKTIEKNLIQKFLFGCIVYTDPKIAK